MVEWKECECLGLRIIKGKNRENHDSGVGYHCHFEYIKNPAPFTSDALISTAAVFTGWLFPTLRDG